MFRPRTERGCVTGLKQLCKLAQVFPLVLTSHLLSGEIFVPDTRAVCRLQDALPCTTQTRPLATSACVDMPVCTMPGCTLPAWRRERTGKELWSSKHQLGWLWEQAPQCPARGHAGDQACISSVPYWALMQSSFCCTNKDPKAIFCNCGIWSVFGKRTKCCLGKCCLGSVQNGRRRTGGTSFCSFDQEDKTAAATTPCKAPRFMMVF